MEPFVTELSGEKRIIERAAARGCAASAAFELLPLCNMSCEMCYVHRSFSETKAGGGLCSADAWIGLAKQMADAGVLFLMLTGGEPLLFPDFDRLYAELEQLGFIITVNTNGTLLDEKWADFFAEHRPRRINITLYGASEDTYEKLCHIRGGYEGALRAIRLLKERELDVKINISPAKANVRELNTLYDLAEELGCPAHLDFYMLPGLKDRFCPIGKQTRLDPEEAAAVHLLSLLREFEPDAFRYSISRMLEQVKNADRLIAESENQTDSKEPFFPDTITCQAGNSSFAINWQGQMRPCVSITEPSVQVLRRSPAVSGGAVNSNNAEAIPDYSSAWETIRQQKKTFRINAKCTRCHLRPICQVCAASSWWETGKYDQVPEYLCREAEEFYRLIKQEHSHLFSNSGISVTIPCL